MTPATVDTDATVLDALDFAHTPPCEALPCRSDPRPAALMARFYQCCPAATHPRRYCKECVVYVFRLAARPFDLTCKVCGHSMPAPDWVVSVHRIDGGEQS